VSVKHALLALLHDGPRFGLQLKQEFEVRTGSVWGLNVGQVYTTLTRLERDGLIVADVDGADSTQKRYRLLTAGEVELNEWFRSPPDDVTPPRDELVIKVLMAMTVADVEVRQVTQVHRRRLIETMQRYTRLKSDAVNDFAFLAVADSLILRAEAEIRWLDMLDARIAAGGRERSLTPAPDATPPPRPTPADGTSRRASKTVTA
jgi:DNA-binding PadR family transcriptional regulator